MAETRPGKPTTGRPSSRIPAFKNIEEEAACWDTHDTTEFEDEFKPATDVRFVVVQSRLTKSISVRLPQDSLAALNKRARRERISPSTLARMWILERLKGESTAPS